MVMRRAWLRFSLPLAWLLSGCTGSDRIGDDELRRTGQWTKADAVARQILLESRRANPTELARLPLRRASGLRRFLDPMQVGETTIPTPDLSAAFGFDFQERVWVLPSQNAILILHKDQPPTILPIDPDAPIPALEQETPEEVYQYLRRAIEVDLRGLLPPAPPAP